MTKLSESIPLLLLIVLVPYFFYAEPNIAQSIIAAALSALVGYRYYLDSLVKPDFEGLFTERLDKKDIETNKKLDNLQGSINELKAAQGKLNIVQNQEDKIKNFKW